MKIHPLSVIGQLPDEPQKTFGEMLGAERVRIEHTPSLSATVGESVPEDVRALLREARRDRKAAAKDRRKAKRLGSRWAR